jgi:hypothetical protein
MISKELNTNPALSDDTYIARLIFKSTQANKGEEDNKTARFSFYMQPNAAAKLREKYDCRYIAYVLEFENNPGTFKFRDFGLKFIFTYSFICAVPQVFIGTFVEKYQLSYILLVYDLEENKYVYADEKEIRTTTHHQTMRKIYLNSLIYDAL